jgi:fatty acid desaturase
MSPAVTANDTKLIGMHPYKRGYSAPAEMRGLIAGAHRTRLWLTAATAVADCMSIVLSAMAAIWVTCAVPTLVAGIICLLAAVMIGRQLRALECMVHEASHFNWSRSHRRVNDILGALLAGLPTGASVTAYRTGHLLHHGRFGTSDDPDFVRYRQLDMEELRRKSIATFVIDVITRLPKYQLGWFQNIKASPLTLAAPFVWSGSVIMVPAFVVFGPRGAAQGAVIWLAAYILALPTIRFIGEADEHVYSTTRTVFDATISNTGFLQRVLIHPHNDGYHTVHHMWPGVPHHQLRRLHAQLMIADKENYAKRIKQRTRIIQSPTAGI